MRGTLLTLLLFVSAGCGLQSAPNEATCSVDAECEPEFICRPVRLGAAKGCVSPLYAFVEEFPEEATSGSTGSQPAQEPLPVVSGSKTFCDVKPILSTYCSGCHGATPAAGAPAGFRLDVFGTAGVKGAHDMAARIKARAVDARTMPPSSPLPAEQLALLSAWIAAGAPDCAPGQTTNPTPNAQVSFKADVQPIFNAYCVSCHGGADPRRKLNLEAAFSYSALMREAEIESGYFRVVPGNVNQSLMALGIGGGLAGVVPAMPYGTPGLKQLSPDAYEVVRRWVEQGALNN